MLSVSRQFTYWALLSNLWIRNRAWKTALQPWPSPQVHFPVSSSFSWVVPGLLVLYWCQSGSVILEHTLWFSYVLLLVFSPLCLPFQTFITFLNSSQNPSSLIVGWCYLLYDQKRLTLCKNCPNFLPPTLPQMYSRVQSQGMNTPIKASLCSISCPAYLLLHQLLLLSYITGPLHCITVGCANHMQCDVNDATWSCVWTATPLPSLSPQCAINNGFLCVPL